MPSFKLINYSVQIKSMCDIDSAQCKEIKEAVSIGGRDSANGYLWGYSLEVPLACNACDSTAISGPI